MVEAVPDWRAENIRNQSAERNFHHQRTITAPYNAQCMIGGCSCISSKMHDATIGGVNDK